MEYTQLDSAALNALNEYATRARKKDYAHSLEINKAMKILRKNVVRAGEDPTELEDLLTIMKWDFRVLAGKKKGKIPVIAKHVIGGIQAINAALDQCEYRVYACHVRGFHDVCFAAPLSQSNHYRIMGHWTEKAKEGDLPKVDEKPHINCCTDSYQLKKFFEIDARQKEVGKLLEEEN